MLDNALFVHAFGYMFELTVTDWCIIATYVAIFNLFQLTKCFLTFIVIPTSYLKLETCVAHRLVQAWFLLNYFYADVCVHVCTHVCVSAPRLLIISGVIWTQYDWLNKFYSLYIASIVSIVSRRSL